MGTPTATLRLNKPATGGDAAPVWGNELNLDMDLIDRAVNQQLTVSVPDANVVLTADGSAADQADYALLKFTGTLTATRTITLPNCMRFGRAVNATSGGFGIILSTGVGGVITLPADGTTYGYQVDGSGNVTVPSAAANINTSGTLAVAGAAAFGSTLSAGNSTLGNITSSGTLTVAGATALNSTVTIGLSGGLVLPFKVNALKTTANNAGISFTTNGMVINLSNSGIANFQFQDALQAYTWSFGNSGVPMTLTGGGNLAIQGTLSQGSDRRIKSDIRTIGPHEGQAWLTMSRPVAYTINGQPSAGFIAQEQIAAGFGDVYYLTDNPDLKADAESPEGKQWVGDTNSRIAYLTAALKAAMERIVALEGKPACKCGT
jgi:hypothetical protein